MVELQKLCDKVTRTPRVTFLDYSIYELDDHNYGKVSVLVEERIDHSE